MSRAPHRLTACLLSCLLGLLAAPAQAHEDLDQTIPESPGLRLGGGLVVGDIRADDIWPSPTLPGIFSNGMEPEDRRKLHLEHATVDVGLRATDWLAGALVLGWHDQDPVHVETAWVQINGARGDDAWALGLGRNHLPMGDVLEGGGHFDRFATMPLAKRAVLGDDWIDDGVSVRWDRSHDGPLPWLETLDLGLWRGRSYPGGAEGPWVPAVHASALVGAWRIDGFAALVEPRLRGGYTQGPNTVHTHDTPDCRGSLVGITCFDGRTDVLGASVAGELPWAGLQLRAGGLLRRDRGLLYTANGEADYRGTTGGGWTDLVWPLTPQVELSLRGESVRGVQTLTGPSAVLAARDAGLLGSTTLRRASAALAYAITPSLRLGVEVGTERHGSARNDFSSLRLSWTPQALWSRSW